MEEVPRRLTNTKIPFSSGGGGMQLAACRSPSLSLSVIKGEEEMREEAGSVVGALPVWHISRVE